MFSSSRLSESRVGATEESSSKNFGDLEIGPAVSSDVIEVQVDNRKGTMIGAIANIINSAVGAGVLSIPFSFASIGWGIGMFLTFLGAIGSWYSVRLIVRCVAHLDGHETKYSDPIHLVNRKLGHTADFAIILFYSIVSCVYIGVAADFTVDALYFMLPNVPEDAWYVSRIFILTLLLVFVGAPLTFMNKLTFMQYTSILSVGFIIYTAILTIYYTTQPAQEACGLFLKSHNLTTCYGDRCCTSESSTDECCVGEIVGGIWNFVSILKAFPILITAYACQPQIFNVYNDLRNATAGRMDVVAMAAMTFCMILYGVMGVCGYMTFGSHVNSDLLSSYPLNLPVTLARLGLGFVLAASYPLSMHPTRDAFFSVVQHFGKFEPGTKKYNFAYYGSIALLVAVTYLIAVANIDIAVILRFAGTISISNVMFTFPAIAYWYLHKDEGKTFMRMSCIPVFLIGVVIFTVNIVFLIIDYSS